MDTAASLMTLMSKIPKNDCIVVLGDMNEQLPANIKGHTGKWAFGKATKNSEVILDLMRMYDLFAVNTAFQPKKGQSNSTYISAGKSPPDNDNLAERRLKAKHKKKWWLGKVIGPAAKNATTTESKKIVESEIQGRIQKDRGRKTIAKVAAPKEKCRTKAIPNRLHPGVEQMAFIYYGLESEMGPIDSPQRLRQSRSCYGHM